MFSRFFYTISAERTNVDNKALLPTFFQHQKTYDFCMNYIKKNNVVLEVGCGSGYGASKLSNLTKEYIAIDNNLHAVEDNRRKYKRDNLIFKHTSFESYNPTRKFDIIICLQVIEHLQSPKDFIKKISFLLKPDGVCILSTPNAITQSYNENPYHYIEYTKETLSLLLQPYFKRTAILGLHGDKSVRDYEKKRKKRIEKIFSTDMYTMRRFIPTSIRRLLFDVSSYYLRSSLINKKRDVFLVSTSNFVVNTSTNRSIDLIAICQKK